MSKENRGVAKAIDDKREEDALKEIGIAGLSLSAMETGLKKDKEKKVLSMIAGINPMKIFLRLSPEEKAALILEHDRDFSEHAEKQKNRLAENEKKLREPRMEGASELGGDEDMDTEGYDLEEGMIHPSDRKIKVPIKIMPGGRSGSIA